MFQFGKNEKQKIGKFNFFLIRYFNILMVAIAVFILIFGFFYFIRPKYSKIRQQEHSAMETAQNEYKLYRDYYSKLKDYIAAYNNISRENKIRVNDFLPDYSKNNDLFAYLEKIIKKHNLILSSMEISSNENDTEAGVSKMANTNKTVVKAKKEAISGSKPPPRAGVIDVKMEIMGVDYFKLKALLSALENNLRLMDIKSIDYSPDNKGLKLEINAYYFKPPSPQEG